MANVTTDEGGIMSRSDEADMRARSLENVEREIRERVSYTPCLKYEYDGPGRLGVLGVAVCGLPVGHEGRHRAGWTTTGKWFG